MDELRDVIAVLRDDAGAMDGLAPPMPLLADLPELVEESRAVGTPVEVRDGFGDVSAVPGTTGRTAYRVVQEALTNARKHAPAYDRARAALATLSAREREVAVAVGRGRTNAEVAGELYVSVATVKGHSRGS